MLVHFHRMLIGASNPLPCPIYIRLQGGAQFLALTAATADERLADLQHFSEVARSTWIAGSDGSLYSRNCRSNLPLLRAALSARFGITPLMSCPYSAYTHLKLSACANDVQYLNRLMAESCGPTALPSTAPTQAPVTPLPTRAPGCRAPVLSCYVIGFSTYLRLTASSTSQRLADLRHLNERLGYVRP